MAEFATERAEAKFDAGCVLEALKWNFTAKLRNKILQQRNFIMKF